ncbi:MAG: hypothetical protein HPY87_10270 [Fervidobacterium sp.]|uniref:hypothetical protein n=1 Tax=Fervidobacterium sp. TaxID=1871331 RepID=UPI0025C0318C|nr:hypothetical protein [Fervidobacterium sp.]NPU90243.1 hypothetical protein [Fervidobacterium sp.]
MPRVFTDIDELIEIIENIKPGETIVITTDTHLDLRVNMVSIAYMPECALIVTKNDNVIIKKGDEYENI